MLPYGNEWDMTRVKHDRFVSEFSLHLNRINLFYLYAEMVAFCVHQLLIVAINSSSLCPLLTESPQCQAWLFFSSCLAALSSPSTSQDGVECASWSWFNTGHNTHAHSVINYEWYSSRVCVCINHFSSSWVHFEGVIYAGPFQFYWPKVEGIKQNGNIWFVKENVWIG